jgi:fructokinase
VPAPRVDVVDTVGAGDSFMAGLVSGLLDADLLGGRAQRDRLRGASFDDVAPAVHRALRTGALTVERAGAHAPLRADLPQPT